MCYNQIRILEFAGDVITDGDVISIIEEFIKKLEAEIENIEDMDMTDDDVPPDDDGSNMPLNLGGGPKGGAEGGDNIDDSEGGEEVVTDTDDSVEEEDEDALPTPEELGAGDLSDNNNPDI